MVGDLPNEVGTRYSFAAVDLRQSTFELLTQARKLVAPHATHPCSEIAVAFYGFEPASATRCAEAITAALEAGLDRLPSYKSASKTPRRTETVTLYGVPPQLDLSPARAAGEGNNLARHLTSLPPNKLTPSIYRKELQRLARSHGWDMKFLGQRKLQEHNAGAFLAVAQGSENDDAGIVHLHYQPQRKRPTARLAIVGKGVCFDTGGTNLKPAKSMQGMHEDMAGSAVAVGLLLALTRLKVEFSIDCWLALSENLIGPRAYKQNDVVTASNGTTIEVVHTDAEGRMLLADTLHLATRHKPTLTLDFATLTGACVYALSTRFSGAFTNRPALVSEIIEAGRASGERVWPFPMDADFDSELESQVADIKQCTLAGEADHILAARFLNRFVNESPWIHVDLAAGNNKGGLAHVPSDVTGFGVRFALELLLGRRLLDKLNAEDAAAKS
jgi:leucyl aminopeptidase